MKSRNRNPHAPQRRHASLLPCLPLLVGLSPAADAAEEPLAPEFLSELLTVYDELPGVSRPAYDSPTSLALSPDGSILYVAHLTGKRIDGIEPTTGKAGISVALPKSPRGIALSPDGAHLYAACYDDKRPRGMICEIGTASGSVARVLEAGHSPCAPVPAPDGSVLYFANRFENKISVMDLATGTTVDGIAVEREPCVLALSPDGGKLVAANLVPTGRSDLNDKRSTVSIINTASLEPESRAIDLWLASMRAVPSPHLDRGSLTEKAQRGKEVFIDRDCDQCHPEDGLFVDGETRLAIKTSEDSGPHDGWWDTPGLHEAWRTAPYLHDGQAATMKDLFIQPISHGLAECLSEEDLEALVEYLLSL